MKCPLTGKICLRPKDIVIAKIDGSKLTNVHLCSQCGGQYLEAVGAMLKTKLTELSQQSIKQEGCPKCGATLQDFLRTRRIGCAECWVFHNKELLALTERSQDGATEHVGKSPKNNKNAKIQILERRMAEAIRVEDYETAAKIRDELKELK